ncbi:MAG: hypothetical protein PF569_09605 [Candidatus Woesearchaeota archaeon]|jgi:polyhydroxyalkanoate synthesis regulator phasin|nr:hypothetical protein [Candidatus Woesearchaeota archaeon]
MTEENYEEVTELDLIYESHDKVDALIDLLIEKGVIGQEEYEERLAQVIEANEEAEDEE